MNYEQLLQENIKLKQQVAQLENILNLLPGHIYWQDYDNVFLGCNLAQAKAVGLTSSSAIVGKTLYDILPEQEASAIAKINLEVITTGNLYQAEEQATFIDGVTRTFLSYKFPMFDKAGNTSGLVGVSLDISRQKQLEQELKIAKQLAEATLEGIVAVMPGNVYWKDNQGQYLGCNDKFANLLGLTSPIDILAKTDYDLLDKAMADIIAYNDISIIKQGTERTLEELGMDEKGNPAFYLTQKATLRAKDGKTIGLVGISIDITDRKRMELALIEAKDKAEAANKAKSDFLTNMSHDIRTPLNGILGFAQILSLRETEPNRKELLGIIHKSSQRLVGLLNEIIELANLETYGIGLQRTRFDIRAVLDELTELMMTEARLKNLELIVKVSNKVPNVIIGDKLRTHRILLNLIGNALKFTHIGGVYIDLAVLDDVFDKNSGKFNIKITVKDTGIGFPQEKQHLIFDKFSRLTISDMSPYRGTGLGLYIVKKFIEDMDGSISVISEENHGTVFVCIMPFKMI